MAHICQDDMQVSTEMKGVITYQNRCQLQRVNVHRTMDKMCDGIILFVGI